MSTKSLVPVFSDKSGSSTNRTALHREVTARGQCAAELIGVLAFNVANAQEDESILLSPIEIDPLDQGRLADMRLVRRRKPGVNPEHNLSLPQLTGLGAYVVEHVVFLESSGDGTLPTANIRQLLADIT